MLVRREFKLMGGRVDYQYVSSVNGKGEPTGYDKGVEYAVSMTEWYYTRVTSYLDSIGAKWSSEIL